MYRPDAGRSYEGVILSRDGQRGDLDEEMLFRRIDDRGQSKADQADYAQSDPQCVARCESTTVVSHALSFRTTIHKT